MALERSNGPNGSTLPINGEGAAADVVFGIPSRFGLLDNRTAANEVWIPLVHQPHDNRAATSH